MQSRVFTPGSARRALDVVAPAADALCRVVRRLEARVPPKIVPESPVEPDYFRDLLRARTLAGALDAAGVRIADAREGIVEFPARRGGVAVWLRFRLGGSDLTGWRPEGGADREHDRPLDDDDPWEGSGEGAV